MKTEIRRGNWRKLPTEYFPGEQYGMYHDENLVAVVRWRSINKTWEASLPTGYLANFDSRKTAFNYAEYKFYGEE